MPADTISVEKKAGGRTVATVTFDSLRVQQAEEQALMRLGEKVKIPGFRPGKVPADMLRSKISESALLEETIRLLLPLTFDSIIQEHKLLPIIPPKVDAKSKAPLSVEITFIERPETKVKGVEKIKVPKEEPKFDEKDVKRVLDHMLRQYQTKKVVDRASKDGDQVIVDAEAKDATGKEVEGMRMQAVPVVLGSKTMLPGMEQELVGLKAGDTKEFTLTIPAAHTLEELRNKPVTFKATIRTVEEVTTPELTDEFVKSTLKVESAAVLKKQIEDSMRLQEERAGKQRREQLLLEEIRKATHVELAPELVEEEMRAVLQEFAEQLQQQNMTLEQWIQRTGKTPEDLEKELKERATGRLTLRFAMQHLVQEKGVTVSDEDMEKIIHDFLAPLSPQDRSQIEPLYKKGEENYEQLKWQTAVEKVMEQMLA